MKYIKIFLLLLIAFSTGSLAYDQKKLMHAWTSVVMVRGYTESGALAYGSGVIVGENEIITNCHVLRNTKQPWASQGDTSYSITEVRADRWQDLCLLTVFNMNRTPVPIGDSKNLVKGQELASIGHSHGAPVPLTTGGYVISTYESNGGRIIRSSAKFRMGASGSGLFDMEGNLVGINTFKTTGYGAYFSMPAEWIHRIRTLPVEKKFPINGKALWEEAEETKPYFLKIAIPKLKEDWKTLKGITNEWIKKEKNNTEAWYENGLVNEKLNHMDIAKMSYEKAIKIDPKNTDALFKIAIIMNSEGNLSKVESIKLKLMDLHPAKADELDEIITCKKNC